MSKVEVEKTMRLHGSADSVIEIIDHWEGMDLIGVRFGAHDGEGGISWSGADYAAMDRDMAQAFARALIVITAPDKPGAYPTPMTTQQATTKQGEV